MRQARYRDIADALRQSIADGAVGRGLLPSESELGDEFAASRVTIRRALDVLRNEGLVDSQQGVGWTVVGDRLTQTLDRLGTIEAQLTADGVVSQRRVLSFAFVQPPPDIARLLDAPKALEVRRLNLADDLPFAAVTVWCAEALGARISRADVEEKPFYELLDVPIGRATQTIGAAIVDAEDAEVLGLPDGAPVLRCRRVTFDRDERPLLVSRFVFPAHLTEFSVELDAVEPSTIPSGLRLVD